MLFEQFFYALRAAGVPASTHNWLALLDALARGLHEHELRGFYQVARCLLCSNEAHYDAFDLVFQATFRDSQVTGARLLADLEAWVRDPKRQQGFDPAVLEALRALDLQELRRQFEERLQTQRGRHEGGSYWIGTGGRSPFGQGGAHPSGIRVGQAGGGRSALAVASQRRFADYRHDRVLDTRQMGAALRRLRALGRTGDAVEVDIEGTIDATARLGELDVRFMPPRQNNLRVLLLMDVGGSMDPYAHAVERLFSAARKAGGFRELRSYYFHNCVYASVYEDAGFTRPISTQALLHLAAPHWRIIVVGDAAMHPQELTMTSSAWWQPETGPTGVQWLDRLRHHFPRAAWLNPDPPRFWTSQSLQRIREIFPMFPLTLEGLDAMVAHLR